AAHFPTVVLHPEIVVAILASQSQAFGRADRHLRREAARPRAAGDVHVELVAEAGADTGRSQQRLELLDLGTVAVLHLGRHQLVGVTVYAIAFTEQAELALQHGPVEDAARQVELAPEAK